MCALLSGLYIEGDHEDEGGRVLAKEGKNVSLALYSKIYLQFTLRSPLRDRCDSCRSIIMVGRSGIKADPIRRSFFGRA